MELTPEAEELLARLGVVAPAEDVAEVRTAATLEAARLRHEVVVPGHVLTILVRGKADAGLLRDLGVDPDTTAAQLLDRTKAEVDAMPRPVVVPLTKVGDTVRFEVVASQPCPECGDTGPRRFEMRRVPNPDGGRGSTTARIALCGACGTPIGPA